MDRCGSGALATTAQALAPASATAASAAVPTPRVLVRPVVRVNQVGYGLHGPKVAFAMLPTAVRRVRFTVMDSRGVVFRGRSADDLGRWNANYGAVYQLTFSALRRQGRYRIVIAEPGAIASPPFRIADSQALYHRLVLNSVRYFTSERDGGDVVRTVLNRRPANLTDRRAVVYADPRYDSNDNLLGKFRRIGGPVNVAGGWFDAGGGYEKFGYTASYTDGLLLMAARDFPGQYRTLLPEADFGLRWISRLWNPVRKVMYVQVGIGNGNASNTIQGDYNFWFLPQAEDMMNVRPGGKPGPTARYVKYRPVFEGKRHQGKPISPDLAGRFAADFALGAQARRAAASAGRTLELLSLARGVYAMAKTSHVGPIVTTFPHDYYPGHGVEGVTCSGVPPRSRWPMRHCTHQQPGSMPTSLWQRDGRGRTWRGATRLADDTLNLYDNGALGEADLLQAMREAGPRPVIRPRVLVSDLAAQLKVGERWAKGDPVRARHADLGPADASPRMRLAWSSPTRCTGGTAAARRPISHSRSNSSTSRSAPTPGAARSSSGPAQPSRTACRARSRT